MSTNDNADAAPAWLQPLTPLEKDVLPLIAEALTNVEIGTRLQTAGENVKACVAGLCAKLQARNRLHVVVKAIQLGLIDVRELPDPTPRGIALLSRREAAIVDLLAEGLPVEQIAGKLNQTTKHVVGVERLIRMKWHIDSRQDLIALARTYRALPAVRQGHSRD